MLRRTVATIVLMISLNAGLAFAGPPVISNQKPWYSKLNPTSWNAPKVSTISTKKVWQATTSPFRAAWGMTKSAAKSTAELFAPPPEEQKIETINDFLKLPRPE